MTIRQLHNSVLMERIEKRETAKRGLTIVETAKGISQDAEVAAVQGRREFLDAWTAAVPDV